MAAQGATEYTGKGPRTQSGGLQGAVQALGEYAKTSTPAYTLAALFAVSAPFGFATPQQAAAEAAAKAQLQQAAAAAAKATQGASSIAARMVASVRAQRLKTAAAVPPFWQLAGFAALFATGGYIIDQGDSLNGSGVVSAWSITYILFRTVPTLKLLPRSPLALTLSTAVVTLGLGVHGSHYFDKTSWKGAIPGLSTDDRAASTFHFDRVGSVPANAEEQSLLKGWSQASKEAARDAEQHTQSSSLARQANAKGKDLLRSMIGVKPSADAQQILASLEAGSHNNDRARITAYLRREAKLEESV